MEVYGNLTFVIVALVSFVDDAPLNFLVHASGCTCAMISFGYIPYNTYSRVIDGKQVIFI